MKIATQLILKYIDNQPTNGPVHNLPLECAMMVHQSIMGWEFGAVLSV